MSFARQGKKIGRFPENNPRSLDHRQQKIFACYSGGLKIEKGMPIYLLSCNTGKEKNSYAEQLSRELKAPVKAPGELLWYYPDGSVAPYAKDGKGKPDYSKPGKIHTFDGSK